MLKLTFEAFVTISHKILSRVSLCGSQLAAAVALNWDELASAERGLILGHSFTGVGL